MAPFRPIRTCWRILVFFEVYWHHLEKLKHVGAFWPIFGTCWHHFLNQLEAVGSQNDYPFEIGTQI